MLKYWTSPTACAVPGALLWHACAHQLHCILRPQPLGNAIRSSRVWQVFREELLCLVGRFGPALQNEALPLGLPPAHHMLAQLQHGGIGHPPCLAAQVRLQFLQQQEVCMSHCLHLLHTFSIGASDTCPALLLKSAVSPAATAILVLIIYCNLSQRDGQV